MIHFPPLNPGFVGILLAFALFGITLGGMYFTELAWNVRVLTRGRRLALALALPLLRLAVVAGGLAFAVLHGAAALLVCLAGLLAARAGVLRIVAGPS